jgi:hypothetical protein
MESLENDSSCRDEKTLSKLKALLVETYVTDARLGRPSCFKPEKNELKYGISATVARAIFLAKQCIHRPEYQLYNLH